MPQRRTVLGGLAALAAAPSVVAAQTPAVAGEVLLVMEKTAATLAFLDASSGARLGEVRLPPFPHEFVVSSDNRTAFVGHYGVESSANPGEGGHAVLVVDLRERRVARSIECSPFNRLHGMALDSRDRLYALSEEKAVLLSIDEPLNATAPSSAVAAGGLKTHLFSLSRDGERAFVTGLLSNTATLVRPRDASVAPVSVTTGRMPEGNCLSPDERTLFVANRRSGTLVAIETDSMRIRFTKQLGGDPLRVYALPDGRLLVTNLQARTITMLSPEMEEIAVVQLDAIPAAASLHPSRPVAFVSLSSDKVAVLDLDTRRIEAQFATKAGADVTRLIPAGALAG
ncbi:YncE family protein [Roseomonas sp. BN140053]|uniref:YncE family protein n=1 Tax=Roseomonas sp. BN140053 TaxID=3391898 RepID=UPI0039ECE63C